MRLTTPLVHSRHLPVADLLSQPMTESPRARPTAGSAEPGDHDPMIVIHGLCKVYPNGQAALVDIDLVLERGETLGLIGESGSGKSTLLRILNRLIEPSEGEVTIDGQRHRDLDPIALRRRIGYVPQDGGLLPHWTVGRNVALVPALLGWEAERRAARSQELLDAVGLEPSRYLERLPRSLSGGERQRVALARALAASPDLLLLDEPFGALDAIRRFELQGLFQELRDRYRTTTVLVSHDLAEAWRLSHRVAVLREGRLLQHGEPRTLLEAPAHPYVERLLSYLVPQGAR